jgi:hypothetical protein
MKSVLLFFAFVLLFLFIIPINANAWTNPSFSGAINLDKLRDDLSTIQALMGGIAVIIVIIMGPYAFLLMAKGSPDDIKKGKEVLFALISGLLIILMSGIIIRFVSMDILKLG